MSIVFLCSFSYMSILLGDFFYLPFFFDLAVVIIIFVVEARGMSGVSLSLMNVSFFIICFCFVFV